MYCQVFVSRHFIDLEMFEINKEGDLVAFLWRNVVLRWIWIRLRLWIRLWAWVRVNRIWVWVRIRRWVNLTLFIQRRIERLTNLNDVKNEFIRAVVTVYI